MDHDPAKTLPSNIMSRQNIAVKSRGNREEIVSQTVCSEGLIRYKPQLGECLYTILEIRGTLSCYGYYHTSQPKMAVVRNTLRNSFFSTFLCIELRIVNKLKIASMRTGEIATHLVIAINMKWPDFLRNHRQ